MKDFLGNTLRVGMQVAYATRSWSPHDNGELGIGAVEALQDGFVRIKVLQYAYPHLKHRDDTGIITKSSTQVITIPKDRYISV